MKKTHVSLYYLVGYLIPAGIALIAVPQFALKLLLSNGNYGDVLPRLVGVVLLALGIIVFQIIRLRAEVLYSTTLIARSVILVCLLGLYLYARDPLFLTLIGIVGLGFILTGVSYLMDRRSRTASEPTSAKDQST